MSNIAEKSLNLINSSQNYLLIIVLVTELDRPLHLSKLQFKITSGFSVSKINVYQIGYTFKSTLSVPHWILIQ